MVGAQRYGVERVVMTDPYTPRDAKLLNIKELMVSTDCNLLQRQINLRRWLNHSVLIGTLYPAINEREAQMLTDKMWGMR